MPLASIILANAYAAGVVDMILAAITGSAVPVAGIGQTFAL
jgi:hypothetical protein